MSVTAIANPPLPDHQTCLLAFAAAQAPVDGNEATARIAYAMSDVSFIYPVSEVVLLVRCAES